MYRSHDRPHLLISTQQQDSRIKSKCSTPKHMRKSKHLDNSSLQNQQQDYDKTHIKNVQYFQHIPKHSHTNLNKYYNKNINTIKKQRNKQMESMIQDQVKKYEIVAGTLKQYIKQQESNNKNKNNRKYVRTVIQIIKAYTKTQITQISPAVSKLIKNILQTVQVCTTNKSKKNNSSNKNKKPQKLEQSHSSLAMRGHSRQFSFSKQPKKLIQPMQSQLNKLQQQLLDLKQQGKVLQQFKSQFQQMNEQDKTQYITQLQQIIKKQKLILDNYDTS